MPSQVAFHLLKPWVLFKRGNAQERSCGWMKFYPCSRGLGLFSAPRHTVWDQAGCFLFLPSFLFLSSVRSFEEDGNVILRAIFKFSGIDQTVLGMNLVSIKFTLSHSSYCKEFNYMGRLMKWGWWAVTALLTILDVLVNKVFYLKSEPKSMFPPLSSLLD